MYTLHWDASTQVSQHMALVRVRSRLLVAGLAGDVGEHVPVVAAGVADPAALTVKAQQGAHYRQGEDLGVRDLGSDAHLGTDRQYLGVGFEQVVGGDAPVRSRGSPGRYPLLLSLQLVRKRFYQHRPCETLAQHPSPPRRHPPLGINHLAAVELRLGEIRARLAQDLISPPQLAYFLLQFPDSLGVLTGGSRPGARVNLGLPVSQVRSASGRTPSSSAILRIAPLRPLGVPAGPRTDILVARSRSSSGYFHG